MRLQCLLRRFFVLMSLLFMPLVFISCGGDDFEDELSVISVQNKMPGKWKNTLTRLENGNQIIEWTFNLSATAEQVKVNDAVSDDADLKARQSENMKVVHYSGKQYTVSFGNGLEYDDWQSGLSSLGMNIEYDGKISGVIKGFLSVGSSKILKLTDSELVIETVNSSQKCTRSFKKVL